MTSKTALQLEDPYLNFLQDNLRPDSPIEVLPLAGDASMRRYYRVIEGENSYVLMCWEPFEAESYPFLSVQSHFQKNGVNVPKVIATQADLGVLLLEDLGDLTLERKFWETQDQNLVIPFYKQALNELLKIHVECTNDYQESCTAFKVQFDKQKLLWEMNYGKQHLIEGVCGKKLSTETQAELESIFSSICETLSRRSKYISHRDFHSRNLMIKLGKMRVIDFQDARLGPIQYDLVSLLCDSYVDLNPEIVNELKAYYKSQFEQKTNQVLDNDEFEYIYQIQIIQRCFKACGSFASFYNTRNDKRYLHYIQPTLKQVITALLNFPEYKFFAEYLINEGIADVEYDKL